MAAGETKAVSNRMAHNFSHPADEPCDDPGTSESISSRLDGLHKLLCGILETTQSTVAAIYGPEPEDGLDKCSERESIEGRLNQCLGLAKRVTEEVQRLQAIIGR